MVRRARNQIVSLKNSNGVWITSQGNIHSNAKDHLSSLFELKNPSGEQISSITGNTYYFLLEESKVLLDKNFSPEEIKKVVFQTGKLKAPSSDGFQAGFFQEYWEIMGEDVIAIVLNFFNKTPP